MGTGVNGGVYRMCLNFVSASTANKKEVNGDKHMHDQRQGAGERERRGCTMQLYTFVVEKSNLLFRIF